MLLKKGNKFNFKEIQLLGKRLQWGNSKIYVNHLKYPTGFPLLKPASYILVMSKFIVYQFVFFSGWMQIP